MSVFKIGFLDIQIWDLLDVALVSVVLYYIMSLLRGTRAIQMVVGIVSLVMLYFLASWAQLNTVVWLISMVGQVGILTLVIVFQPELRGGLAKIGTYGLSGIFHRQRRNLYTLEEIVKASIDLSNRGLGGLMVIEQEVGLKNYIETGKPLTSKVNADLLVSIFFSNAPLHDGAVIIRGDSIVAAGCALPLTQNPAYDYLIGMRHRAAVGISFESDAITVVISEETGNISVTRNGQLRSNIPQENLHAVLMEMLKA